MKGIPRTATMLPFFVASRAGAGKNSLLPTLNRPFAEIRDPMGTGCSTISTFGNQFIHNKAAFLITAVA
jgi:hypothetical protein